MRPTRLLTAPLRNVLIGVLVALAVVAGCSSGDGDDGAAASSTSATPGNATGSDDWDGEVSVLTYNVAGLPEVLSGSNPEQNTALIGPKLNDFDLVLVQESWQTPDPNPLAPTRVYHEILVEASTHEHHSPMPDQPLGSDPSRPEALLADGLGFFSNHPMGEITRVAWHGCFGGADTSDRGAADCLAFKGFAVTTVTLGDGVEVDVYNLHAEAGSSDQDQALQVDDYEQLAAFIDEHSAGRAIILGGDTNLHIEDDPDNPQDVEDATIWAEFLEATGLVDACDPADCDDHARIDKFAYRSGGGVELGLIERVTETERFTDDAGEQLSDHQAVSAVFGWRRTD